MDFSHSQDDRETGPVEGLGWRPDAGTTKVSTSLAQRRKRLKLWAVSSRFHCSILGTCLTPEDLRQCLSKLGVSGWEKASDMAIHSYCVEAAARSDGTPGRLARLMQKLLDRRYPRAVRAIGRLTDPEDIRGYWKSALAEADVPGPYWAVFSHPFSPESLLEEVFGDVHILTHRVVVSEWQNIEHLRKAAQERDRLAEECRDLRARSGVLREERDESRNENARLSERIRDLELSNARAETERAELAALNAAGLARELAQVRERLGSREDRCLCLEQRTAEQKERIAELESYVGRLRAGLVDALSGAGCPVDQECPNYPCDDLLVPAVDNPDAEPAANLRGHTVLFIGGRNRQHRFYRDLVEMMGGKLRHHDGGLEKSASHLDQMLRGADAVICQTDCVSHDACRRAKAWAKGQGIPLVMMKRTGVRAFTGTLRDIGRQFGTPKGERTAETE